MNRYIKSLLALFLILGCKVGKKNKVDLQDSFLMAQESNIEVSPIIEPPYPVYVRKYYSSEFSEFYNAFFSSILERNEWAFDYFIHPGHGLFIIDANGAIPQITKVNSISKYKRLSDKQHLFNYKGVLGKHLIFGELPKINCDYPSGYNKDGCFTSTENPLLNSNIENAATLVNTTPDELKKIISWVGYTTVNTSNYTFYFILVDGYWYIGLIDVRSPCQA